MGKKSREKKERKSRPIINEREGISRRLFVKGGIATVCLTAVGSSQTNLEDPNLWNFLEPRKLIPHGNSAQSYNRVIRDHFVQFGSKQKLTYREAMVFVQRAKNWPVMNNVALDANMLIERLDFVKPMEVTEGENFRSYVTGALDFMHSQIPNLSPGPEKINLVKHGEEYGDINWQAGISDYYYSSYNIEGIDLPIAIRNQGSKISFQSFDDWYIIFGAGESGLPAPWSEALVPSTHLREKKKQVDEVGFQNYLQLQEAITEGLSLTLCLEFGREKGVPNIEEKLKKVIKNFRKFPVYRLVPASGRMIEDIGMADTYNFFKNEHLADYKNALEQYL